MVSKSARHASRRRWRQAVWLGAGWMVAAAIPLAAQDPTARSLPDAAWDYDASLASSGIDGEYGYFRTVDGSATVIQAGGERIHVQANEPILQGDRVFVSERSRVEMVLADRNIVRADERTELGFRALANSADAADEASVVELRRGTAQVVVVAGQRGTAYPSVITPNATVRLRNVGSYLVVVDGDDRTEVVVREGRAEVLTDGDGAEVRPGESLFVDGRRGTNLEFAAAPGLDRLERWGDELGAYARGDESDYGEDDPGYASSDLDRYGSWIEVSGGRAWRPYVSVGWAPYRAGRWRYTPSGLFWVSYEPWGWVPYHYGYWDYVSAYGWVWFPGRRFAPAHVYWYWGPHYAGWVPTGYYFRHYGHTYGHDFGFYFGVYGTVGGHSDAYRRWTFIEQRRLGHRNQDAYTLRGFELARRRTVLERGILTTDTRPLRPDVWRRPTEGIGRLTRAARARGRELPDAQAFVDRAPRLPRELERVTLRGGDLRSRAPAGDVRSDGRDIGARRPEVGARVRSRDDGRRPRLDGRTRPAGRSASPGTAAGRSGDAAGRPGDRRDRRALQRPAPSLRERPATVREGRPTLDGGGAGRQASPRTRRPEARSRAAPTPTRRAPTLRRPSNPATPRTRPSAPRVQVENRSRPTVRSSGGSPRSRPTVRSSGRSRSGRSGG